MKSKDTNKLYIYIYALVIIIIILLVLFYLFDEKNIKVQKNLKDIHSNGKILNKKYPLFINDKYNIKTENNIIIIENFLVPEYHSFLQKQFNNKTYNSSNIGLRKATGINFFNLHDNTNYFGFLELFYSNEITNTLTNILAKPIQRTPLSDTNACSLLIYSNELLFLKLLLNRFAKYFPC